jgi:hypothetical protein
MFSLERLLEPAINGEDAPDSSNGSLPYDLSDDAHSMTGMLTDNLGRLSMTWDLRSTLMGWARNSPTPRLGSSPGTPLHPNRASLLGLVAWAPSAG